MNWYRTAQVSELTEVARSKGYNIGPVYHGTASEFNTFENVESVRGFDSHLSPSHSFTESPDLAEAFGIDRMQHVKKPSLRKMNVFLAIHNPIDLTKKTPELIDILVEIGENRDDLEELGTNFYWQIVDDAEFVKKLIEKGYDGAICDESDALKHFGIKVRDNETAHTYAVFKSSQIKSADDVTMDDNGEEIPLGSRFDINNPDIRY